MKTDPSDRPVCVFLAGTKGMAYPENRPISSKLSQDHIWIEHRFTGGIHHG